MNNIIQTIRHAARATAVLLLALCAAQTAGAWTGSGTSTNPYQITSASDLNMIYTMVNTSGTNYENVYFVQTADIDCSTLPVWNDTQGAGIGRDASHPFKGRYDGGGHKIKNLRITATDSQYAGLFGYIQGGAYGGIEANTNIAEVHGVVLVNPTITITANGSEKFAGAIVGYAGNCSQIYDNTVIGGSVTYTGGSNYNTDYSYVGGIVGSYVNSNFQRLVGNTVVGTSLSGAGVSGGLAGILDNHTRFSGNFADASISGADFRAAGVKREGALVGHYTHYSSSDPNLIVNYYHSASGLTAYGDNYTNYGSSYSMSPVADNAWAAPLYPDSGTSGLTVSGGEPIVSLNGTNYSTQGTTYTIYDAAGWNIFCGFLNDNETHNRFSGKTVRLGADITVSRMAGSSGHDFCGTFDGDGHTLTFNYGTAGSYASEQNIAPFSYVSNVDSEPATIKNLHVAGHIYTSAKYAAGIVGQHWGTLTIENCRSSIVIHSSVGGDGTHGGIEAASNGTLNITGCVFDGKLLTTGTTATTLCGGFVGYGALSVSNSLYAPAALAGGENEITDGSATFVRNSSAGSNCYYTRTLGTAQGKQARSITAGDGVTLAHAGVATEYSVSGITAYKSGGNFTSGILYNNVLYAGSGDAVSLTSTSSVDAPAGYQYSYTASAGTLSGSANPYTLTMPDADVTVTATVIVIPWDGDGSEGNPYLIKYASQLDLLAHRVNGTHGETRQSDGYYNTYFQLDNDISYPHTSAWNASASTESNYEAIGGYYNKDSRSFRGHFDGNSKTISGIRIYKGGYGDADRFQGIFGLTDDGADIHDLTLADARITGYGNTGGIVGYNEGGTVTRCHVAGDVAVCAVQSGADYHGGIVGYNDGGTIEQCTSAATLTTADAAKSYNYGGIAGINDHGTLRDNLAIGATVPALSDNSYGAIVGYNYGTLQRNYYAACKVADVENATGVGCGYISGGNSGSIVADVTDNDGAMAGYRLTLGDGITSSAWSITIPKHKELNSSGQLATVAAVTYNVAVAGTTVWFNSGETEGYSASYSVNGSPVSGNSITMPAAAVTVTSNGGESIDLWGIAGGANGNSDHPYTITTTEGWNLLAGNVAAGKSYSDKYFQLGADNISISTMVGTSACHFSGHFNGNGNTLAVSMTSAGEYTAPFRYVGGATITGLHTTGTVTTAHKYATGLVGRHDGNVTISNCRSSVAIVSSVSGDGTHGGFVATGSGTATIEGCLFDGVICTTASDPTNSCGGFVGWNGGTVNISNSLYAPASVPEGKHAIGTDGCATFARNGVNSIANSYYTESLGDAQGKACHSVTAGTDVTVAHAGVATHYATSGITAYKATGASADSDPFIAGLLYNNNVVDVLYAGSGDEVSLTLSNTAPDAPDGYQYGYTTNAGTLDGSTLTMPDQDVTVSLALTVLPWSGDGTKDNPYIIYNKDQLDLLAHRVNGTHDETANDYYNTYFQLANDITYPHKANDEAGADTESNYEAIGGDFRSFRGHFDGNKKTISGIRIYKGGNGYADSYQGIFGLTDGADIHDLTLADARITGYGYTGGIVGYNGGGTVTRCHVAGDVAVCAEQSDAYCHGGIVGRNYSGTIEQCTSAVTLTTPDAGSCWYYGGIAGRNEGGTLRDNLAIGATVPAAEANSYGAITGYNEGGTLWRNYYAACTVAGTENATDVGCAKADITANDGAVPGYLLTLGDGITSSAWSITIPEYKELDGNGQLVTVAARTYNVAAEGTTVWFNSGQPEGYSASYSVNGSPVSGNSITMPAANVTVTSNGGESIDLWGIAGGANGNSDHPYTITTTEGWNLLAGNVAAGKSYSDKYFQLGADNISISTMVGTNACHFSGHFNGNGNTLAVNITSAGEYTAPFRYVGGATITGLHTTGTVTTAHIYATGLVGQHDGDVTISNCRSSVAIVSSVSGGGIHGGFVAIGSGTATIEGCLFDGVICTTASGLTNTCGGFVGWCGENANISNSLYAPAAVPEGKYAISTYGCSTFARPDADIANSYYTQVLGDAQGKACHSVTAGTDVTIDAIALTGDATAYTVSGITAYSGGGLQRGETLYYGSGDEVSLTLSNTATGDVPAGYRYDGYTASAGTLSGSTLIMPDQDVTISVLRSTGVAVPVTYVDADGNTQTAQAIALDGTESDLGNYGEGWYFVGLPTVAFDHNLYLYGDVHLILADGCTMNVTSSDDDGIEVYGSLTIYGQTDGTGTLNATGDNEGISTNSGTITISGGTVTATGGEGIHSESGNITISGGRVTASGGGAGIFTYGGTITISGGRVTATGGTGIFNYGGTITISGGSVTATSDNDFGILIQSGNLTLGCTTASDFIYASSYSVVSGGTLNIADGQELFDEDGNSYSGNDVTIPAGKTLRLSPGIALAAHEAPDQNYWTTYYNSFLGFTIEDDVNACAYTATYGAGQLTLHKLGKEIPAGTAVIIVADNDVVSMTADDDLSVTVGDNDLHGVDVDTDVADITSALGDGTFYVLGMTTVGNEQHFGFHRYTGEKMAAHKAFVFVSGSQALARSLTMVFDEATGIVSAEANSSLFTLHSSLSSWFTLDGRRLQAKPTAPGIYVNNGKKVVIK